MFKLPWKRSLNLRQRQRKPYGSLLAPNQRLTRLLRLEKTDGSKEHLLPMLIKVCEKNKAKGWALVHERELLVF